MNKLDAYVGKTVLLSVLAVFFVVVGLDVVFGFIAELDQLEKDYQTKEALIYTLYTIPRRIYLFIPVCALIGCLIGLGALASNSELTVMRAAGISVPRIVMYATKPLVMVVAIGLLLAQFVVPQLEQYAQSERAMQQNGGKAISARHGYWYREENRFIHVTAIQPNGVMFGVARFDYDNNGTLKSSDFSEKAIFQGDHWILQDVRLTTLEKNRSRVQEVSALRWNTAITPDMLSTIVLLPDYLSISGLYEYSNYLVLQGIDSTPYYFAFWKKVMQPLATVVMVFIAVSFIFGPLRSVTMGQRITAGVVTGLTFNYTQDILGHVSIVFHVPPVVAASAPIVVCLVFGVVMLRRA
ncbi:LPS export ABC transporter permease LptG [Gammaproteobacteria bacterium 45_16_T64]|nr:LPS export ABC transporter permease LptG [Gammaproteobacteria bacterium 45_16_T64]